MASVYTKQMQRIVRQYIDAGQRWPATTREMARWAIANRLWEPQPSTIVDQCADHLSRALAEEYIDDPQGRSVRAKHAARVEVDGKQETLWADIRTAPRSHMEAAFRQRRGQILGECRQLKADVDSFNQNASPDNPVPLVLDFTYDLAEEEALTAGA
jgi:hypothetical protein